MHRRQYLAALGTLLLAGCSGQSDDSTPEATPTPERTTTAPPTTTSTPEPTPEATPTATEEPTPTETETPEPTPTAFEQATGEVRTALRTMLTAYVEQGEDAEALVDIGGNVSFSYGDLNEGNSAAGEAHLDARDAATTDGENELVDQLDAVRYFLWKSAQAQERWSDAYDVMVDCRHELDDEELDAWDRLPSRASVRAEYRAVRSSYRDAQDQSTATDMDAFDGLSQDDYSAKLDQFDLAIDNLSALYATLETFAEATAELNEGNYSEAEELYGEAGDEIEAVLRDGVEGSMELEFEEFAELAFRKQTKADSYT